MFTFDTPESTDGIYLNLSTFQARDCNTAPNAHT